MCLATQSASDVLDSPISRTILEQTPTKIFFPNADASVRDHREGMGLTAREVALVREQLEPGSRAFLVRQGHHSLVCRLDLAGFDAELAVISGRAAARTRLDQLIATHGPDPAGWLPVFMAENRRPGSIG
jgi:type IV secretion system protein VirB4